MKTMTQSKARISQIWLIVLAILMAAPATTAADEPFQHIRIGDADGFGFISTNGLLRPDRTGNVQAADSNRNGRLEPGEFVPDLNGDGAVWYAGDDNFDNRSMPELIDREAKCLGCLAVGKNTRGANWTDLSLSTTAPAINWPDDNGPQIPNNATFVFDFTVKKDRIAEGSQIFFNLVYADYDVNPATIRVEFANGKVQNLALENTASFGFDGLIEARTAFFSFDDVFTLDADGNWKGFARVVFLAPFEPWTAFDFVEMSLVGLS